MRKRLRLPLEKNRRQRKGRPWPWAGGESPPEEDESRSPVTGTGDETLQPPEDDQETWLKDGLLEETAPFLTKEGLGETEMTPWEHEMPEE